MRQQSVTPGSNVTLVVTRPTTDQYLHLRQQAGLDAADQQATETGLAASLHSVCAFHENQVVGCGRIVGDGGLYFYVEDLMVDKGSRGAGTGGRIMQALLDWLRAHVREGALVGANVTEESRGFFMHHGFREWPDSRPGMFLPPDALQPGRLSSPSR